MTDNQFDCRAIVIQAIQSARGTVVLTMRPSVTPQGGHTRQLQSTGVILDGQHQYTHEELIQLCARMAQYVLLKRRSKALVPKGIPWRDLDMSRSSAGVPPEGGPQGGGDLDDLGTPPMMTREGAATIGFTPATDRNDGERSEHVARSTKRVRPVPASTPKTPLRGGRKSP